MEDQEQEAILDLVEMFCPLFDQTLSELANVSLNSEDDMSNEVLINKIQEYIAQNELSDDMVVEGASIICDLEQNPYFGEEDSDKYTFQHAGRICTMKRNPNNKSWLAYAEYSNIHDYEDISVEVHGGLTYGDEYKVGMDFVHYYDIVPAYFTMEKGYIIEDPKYRDYDYVKKEVESLAEQLNALPQLDEVSDLEDDLPELVDSEEEF